MITVAGHDYPFASVYAYLRPGARFDPEGLEGLTYLTGQMLLRGAGDRDQAAFSQEIETLGASLETSVGRDSLCLEGDTLTRNLEPWLDLVSDALHRPRFDAEELGRLKRQVAAEVRELRDNDEDLCSHVFYQALQSPDSAGRPVKGGPESLSRIELSSVRACYDRLMGSEGAILGVCGAVDDAAAARIQGALALNEEGDNAPRPYASEDPGKVRVVLVDKPERTQTQIMAGHLVPTAGHPDYYPLLIANTVFGGTFTSRLSYEIREKRGWSYGAYSTLACRRDVGTFTYRFYPADQDTPDALHLALLLHQNLVEDGITADELEFAQSYLVNTFPFHLQTPKRRLMEALRLKLLGLPEQTTARYVSEVQSVSLNQVNAAVRRHLKPRDLTVVLVGTARSLQGRLDALQSVDSVEVHPYDAPWTESPGS